MEEKTIEERVSELEWIVCQSLEGRLATIEERLVKIEKDIVRISGHLALLQAKYGARMVSLEEWCTRLENKLDKVRWIPVIDLPEDAKRTKKTNEEILLGLK